MQKPNRTSHPNRSILQSRPEAAVTAFFTFASSCTDSQATKSNNIIGHKMEHQYLGESGPTCVSVKASNGLLTSAVRCGILFREIEESPKIRGKTKHEQTSIGWWSPSYRMSTQFHSILRREGGQRFSHIAQAGLAACLRAACFDEQTKADVLAVHQWD